MKSNAKVEKKLEQLMKRFDTAMLNAMVDSEFIHEHQIRQIQIRKECRDKTLAIQKQYGVTPMFSSSELKQQEDTYHHNRQQFEQHYPESRHLFSCKYL
ncbi:hypothetical protein AB6E77_01670 [Vibrio sp. 10N.247.311.18]|uniref:hypothetical protein n=1 Tax=unclassified Vibrio TaxID=2614977 RepID=UPI00354EC399